MPKGPKPPERGANKDVRRRIWRVIIKREKENENLKQTAEHLDYKQGNKKKSLVLSPLCGAAGRHMVEG